MYMFSESQSERFANTSMYPPQPNVCIAIACNVVYPVLCTLQVYLSGYTTLYG